MSVTQKLASRANVQQVETPQEPSSLVKQDYKEGIQKMRAEGCKEEDILGLLEVFLEEFNNIEVVYTSEVGQQKEKGDKDWSLGLNLKTDYN